MPGFVHRAKQPGIQEIGVEAGRDAHILRANALGERVSRSVLATMLPIVTKAADHLDAKIPLLLFIEGLV